MNRETNKLLFEKYHATRSIVTANVGLLIACAHQFRRKYGLGRECDIEELKADGGVGLIKSVESFDLSKGFQFSTYACRGIFFYLRREHYKRIGLWSNGTYHRFKQRAVSLDSLKDAYDFEPSTSAPEEPVDKDRVCSVVSQLLRHVRPRERDVIRQTFLEGQTLQQLAESVGVSRQRIDQLRDMGIRRMKRAAGVLKRSGLKFTDLGVNEPEPSPPPVQQEPRKRTDQTILKGLRKRAFPVVGTKSAPSGLSVPFCGHVS